MRKHLILTLAALLVAFPFTQVMALDSPQDGRVDVFVALTVAETVEMDFGAVIDADGTVTLDVTDTIASDPNGIHQGGTVASGLYTINGQPSTAIDVSISAQNANGLLLSNFTTDAGGGVFPLVGVLIDGVGNLAMALGADLQVQSGVAAPGANQPLNFTITVTYN
ncbi:DUF4402 domain-containing protein [bacterium]|nr:DUF4402 domain-containing protein [bacterium]MBU1074239.1 DUF4402 domain-containing protein [bacterium]MBU1675728.1 DUF4402 domain-containing protein [bacterium]